MKKEGQSALFALLIYPIPDPAKEVESIDLSLISCAKSGVANTCSVTSSGRSRLCWQGTFGAAFKQHHIW